MAISDSINQIHIPSFGVYNGSYGPRPRQVFTNSVLAFCDAEVRQATPTEIDTRLQMNATDHNYTYTPETDASMNNTEVNVENSDEYTTVNAKCHIDPGATPCVIKKSLVEQLGLYMEKARIRLGVVGVFGEVKYAEYVCWVTITFKCQRKITVMAVIVENMSSPFLIGQTDFKHYDISHITKKNLLIFGDHTNSTHTENLMSEAEVRAYPRVGYTLKC